MGTSTQMFWAAHTTLPGFLHHILETISAGMAERRALRRMKAEAAALRRMNPSILEDIGVQPGGQAMPLEQLARFNPTVLAVNVFCIRPRGS